MASGTKRRPADPSPRTTSRGQCTPVVKWAGGKTRLLGELVKRLPGDYWSRRHVELFAGGAALLLHLRPASGFLSDRNEHLVELYRVLKSPELRQSFKLSLQGLARHHGRAHYYKVRERFRAGEGTRAQAAATFVYLNRAGFNGLYRENRRGEFNVPFGDVAQGSIYQPKVIDRCAEALQGVTVMHTDFRHARCLRDGIEHFVYLDPPYAPTQRTSFSCYLGGGFHHEDHLRVLELMRDLDRRGVKVMLSNADTFFVRDLFRDYRIDAVQGSRSISRDGAGRGRVVELVIRNYGGGK